MPKNFKMKGHIDSAEEILTLWTQCMKYIFIHVGKEMKIIEFAKGLDLDEVVYLELLCLPSIL